MKPVKAWAIRRKDGTLLPWERGVVPVAIFHTRKQTKTNVPLVSGERVVRVEIREVKRRKAAK